MAENLENLPIRRRGSGFKYEFDQLPEDWETLILDAAQEGKGLVKWCILLCIHPDTFRKFVAENEHFKEVYEIARLLEQSWWEEAGQLMVTTGKGAQNVYALIMKQKFGWSGVVATRTYNNGYLQSISTEIGDLENEEQGLSKDELLEELAKRGLPTTMFKKQNDETIDGEFNEL